MFGLSKCQNCDFLQKKLEESSKLNNFYKERRTTCDHCGAIDIIKHSVGSCLEDEIVIKFGHGACGRCIINYYYHKLNEAEKELKFLRGLTFYDVKGG